MNALKCYISSKSLPTIRALSKANLRLEDDDAAETVAKHISKIINLVRLDGADEIYIYNFNGYYEKAERWLLQAIVKHVLNAAKYNWSTRTEREILGALLRDTTDVISAFNTENAMNFKNGVFYLDKGVFNQGHSPGPYFNHVLDFDYSGSAGCPRFIKFIEETMCGNPELISVIQELMGYCISSSTKAEKAFFLYGKGCNGKSVLASVIRKLVGEKLTSAISLKDLSKPFGASGLIGKRLNIAPENEGLENSEILKALVSCDNLNISVKYKPDWEGQLMARHIFLMNNLPSTNDLSEGFFRKIIIIPFNYTVEPDKIDKYLLTKLESELPGIFNWAYEGYERLISNNYKFSSSEAIDEEMKKYREEENPTGLFFQENYKRCPKQRIKKSDLYRTYEVWAEVNGCAQMNRVKFYNALLLEAEAMGIKLEFKRVQGINYLMDYKVI